ncbi:MAG: ATP-binding cassette domain-containing protein, partial [Muribaculaceae bacterium]|nr:ATP-binding cassette domain-containing protein [Muribaculaceae bacterium]
MDSQINYNPRLISLDRISMEWDGHKVLDNVSLDVYAHDFLAITGPNGGGKSTLLRILLQLLKPTSGTVTYHSPEEQLHVGYLPQKNMIDSRFPITVQEVVASGLYGPFGKKLPDHPTLINETLKVIELESHRDASIGNLSGGQLQRALLGRAIISRPSVLVLDEPLSYLDKHFEHHTYDILKQLAPTTAIVLVSHEMTAISSMATRHLIVDHTLHECT